MTSSLRIRGISRLLAPVTALTVGIAASSVAYAAEGQSSGGLPQLNPETFASQLFWLFLSFGVFYLLMSRVALPKVRSALEERDRRISSDLEKAGQLKAEAEGILAEYEKAVADARAKASAVLSEAADAAAQDAAKRTADLDAKLNKRLKEAEERIAAAKAEALENLRSVASDAAASALTKLTGLDATEKQLESAIEKAMKEQA
ncbi:MAG: F0F1 ATP synthase subunit B' [Alphaproteobacteria bacterium]|nr:F0F1 ATP synthase subunit B' [Alphaproteobacteria bacterium]